MLQKIIITIGAMLFVFLGYIALQPADFEISREVTINATPDMIFPYINNSKKADSWMPWQELDANMQTTYSGPEEGIGAMSEWQSTGDMGVGQSQVIESVLNETVKTKLTYKEPVEMEEISVITLTPAQASTVVRWSIIGKYSFMMRLMTVFTDMDEMVGSQFEKGLARLKSITETNSTKASNQ